MDELVALNTVNRIWRRLEALLTYRQNIKKYPSLIGKLFKYIRGRGLIKIFQSQVY